MYVPFEFSILLYQNEIQAGWKHSIEHNILLLFSLFSIIKQVPEKKNLLSILIWRCINEYLTFRNDETSPIRCWFYQWNTNSTGVCQYAILIEFLTFYYALFSSQTLFMS